MARSIGKAQLLLLDDCMYEIGKSLILRLNGGEVRQQVTMNVFQRAQFVNGKFDLGVV